MLAVLGGHVGVAGADVLVAGGARRDAVAALAAGVARPQTHLGPPGLAAPERAARAAVCACKPGGHHAHANHTDGWEFNKTKEKNDFKAK